MACCSLSDLKKRVNQILDNGGVPDEDDFTIGYRCMMSRDDNEVAEIDCKYKTLFVDEIGFQDVLKVQSDIVNRLIGNYYESSEEKIVKPRLSHFFVWSIISKEKAIAEKIFERFETEDKISAALFAVALLKALSRESSDDDKKDQLIDFSREFNTRAEKQMQKEYEENEKNACNKLEKISSCWGNTSILTIAVESSNKDFLRHQVCKTFCKALLRNELTLATTTKQFTWRLNLLLELGPVPDKHYLPYGYQSILKDDKNLIVEICLRFGIDHDYDKTDTVDKCRTLQTTLLYLLIGQDLDKEFIKNLEEESELLNFFVWSLFAPRHDVVVLSKSDNVRQDMAMKIWLKLDEKYKISAALLASALLKEMAEQSIDDEEQILTLSRQFTKNAGELVQKEYEKNNREARRMLQQKEKYVKTSIIQLAVGTKNLDFLKEPVCKTFLTEQWMGHLSPKMSITRMLICLFCVVIGPLCFAKYRQPSSALAPRPFDQPDVDAIIIDRKKQWLDDLGIKMKFVYFFTAPVIRFLLLGVTYLIFLGAFSYILLITFSSEMTTYDTLLITAAILFFVEDFVEIVATFMKEKYNDSSCCNISINHFDLSWKIYVPMVLRRYMSLLESVWGVWFVVGCLSAAFFFTGYILKLNNSLDAARIVLGFDLILLYLRSLRIFAIHSELGPRILMIGHMFKDLFYFVCILMAFVVSYAVATQSIMYPNAELSIEFALNLLKRAYWNLYGELLIEELEQKEPSCTFDKDLYINDILPRCPTASSTVWVPIMMGFYILITNILLLNLLIAILGSTYGNIQENREALWNYDRFYLIKQYKTRLWTPLLPFYYIYNIYTRIKKKCCTNKENE